MKYSLVIFDFDGTLADSMPWFQTVCNNVADEFGFRRIATDEIDSLRRTDARHILKNLGIPMWQVPLIAHRVRGMMASNLAAIPLFEGVDAMLHALDRAGVTLVVVSSNSHDNVQRMLGPTLTDLIDHFACGAGIFGKAAKFRKLLKQLGLKPTQALAIGDELRDLEAANRVKIPFGAVAWGYTHVDALRAATPAWVFDAPRDIVNATIGD